MNYNIIPKIFRLTKGFPPRLKSPPRFSANDKDRILCYFTGKPQDFKVCECKEKCIGHNEHLNSIRERGIIKY